MKKQFLKKLKSRAGETLVETLVAILISTFASLMLAGATSTAMELNRQARARDRVNQTCLERLAKEDAVTQAVGSLKVTRLKPDPENEGKFVAVEKDGVAVTSSVKVNFIGCTVDSDGTIGDFSTFSLYTEDEEEP